MQGSESLVATAPTAPEDRGEDHPARADAVPRGRIGWIVAGSLFAGLIAALLLAAAPFIPADESHMTGAVLCGFALGWAMLAVLSVRFTDQPQRWAIAPALFMGISGLLLLVFGSPALEVLSWIWPPVLLALAIWMFIRARRQLRSRSGRWLIYPVLGMLALASIGGGYETVQRAVDAGTYPMPGQLIDVGGHSLHLNCTGSGSPTVVLEPGAGLSSSDLGWISPAVAAETRVCVYDRAGRGWSEPAETPQDGMQIATDLHTLLQRGNVPGPYVVAGHSFGGLYALIFADQYPDEVAGMVLVDSTAPASAVNPVAPSSDEDTYDILSRASALISTSARLGLARLYALSDYDSLPPHSRDESRANAAHASQISSTIDEYVQANAAIAQAGSLSDFDDKPLAVVTADIGNSPGWSEKQDALAALSTNSVHQVVDGATHPSLLLNEEHAAAVTEAILDVVASVRNAAPMQ